MNKASNDKEKQLEEALELVRGLMLEKEEPGTPRNLAHRFVLGKNNVVKLHMTGMNSWGFVVDSLYYDSPDKAVNHMKQQVGEWMNDATNELKNSIYDILMHRKMLAYCETIDHTNVNYDWSEDVYAKENKNEQGK